MLSFYISRRNSCGFISPLFSSNCPLQPRYWIVCYASSTRSGVVTRHDIVAAFLPPPSYQWSQAKGNKPHWASTLQEVRTSSAILPGVCSAGSSPSWSPANSEAAKFSLKVTVHPKLSIFHHHLDRYT